MSNAFHGYGTVIKRGDGTSPQTFTTIAEVKRIKPPGYTTDVFEVTHLTSPGAVKEKVAGMRDSSNVTCTANYLPQNATHQQLITDSQSRATNSYQIVMSDADDSVWAFEGFVSRYEPGDISVDGGVEVEFEITVTTAPTPPV